MVFKVTLVSALAPFGLVEVGAEIGAELNNNYIGIVGLLECPAISKV